MKSVKSIKKKQLYDDDAEKQPESFNFTFNPKEVETEPPTKRNSITVNTANVPTHVPTGQSSAKQKVPFKDITSNLVSRQLHPVPN